MAELLANPGLVLILGSAGLPLLRGPAQRIYLLALPLAALALLVALPYGNRGRLAVFGLELVTVRLDRLSFLFGLVFLLAAVIAVVYSWHLRDTTQHVAGVVYAGSAMGALLAGDLLTLFLYWELTAVASVFLIWARRTEGAYRAGQRYLVIQMISGLALLAGAVVQAAGTGSLAFDPMTLEGPAAWLIFLAFGVKCAFPLLHNWLQDSYPKATVTGTVWLSVFTTKLAVYTLARGFAGVEPLIWIGVTMTLFPIFFAVIENDLRKVLAYSLNNQLGFMVTGIGIGTELAVNGAAGHAFAHIIYKALLFMSMGAVLHRTGTIKASELGGLYRTMPWTAGLCIVGSASISAFPLLSGFVTKSMIMSAAAEEGYVVAFLLLLVASAGVMDHSGIKIPFFSFFAHDSGKRPREAPLNMLLAMGAAAVMCVGIGLYPRPLYEILPYPVDYVPYTATHILTQLQLLVFAAIAFAFLYRRGWYPGEIPAVNIDLDVIYRKAAPALIRGGMERIAQARDELGKPVRRGAERAAQLAVWPFGSRGWLGAQWSSGYMVWWVAFLLGFYLLVLLFL